MKVVVGKDSHQNPVFEDIFIHDPEFSFIFTISLDGRIDMRSILSNKYSRDDLKKILYDEEERKVNGLADKEYACTESVFDSSNGYFNVKERYFKRIILFDDCEKECPNEECDIDFVDLTDGPLPYFVDTDFINKAVLGRWRFKPNHKIMPEGKNLFVLGNEDYFDKVLKGYKKKFGNNNKYEDFKNGIVYEKTPYTEKEENNKIIREYLKPQERKFIDLQKDLSICPTGVLLTMYSNGSISILVQLRLSRNDRNDNHIIKISPEVLVDLILYPNLVKTKDGSESMDGDIGETDNNSIAGFLNFAAYDIANDVFNNFFECLEVNRVRDKKVNCKPPVDFLKIERIKPENDDVDNMICERYSRNEYTTVPDDDDMRYIRTYPYVGVMFDSPMALKLGDEREDNPQYKAFAKLLAGVSTQTSEFLKHHYDPMEYLRKESLTRGSKDAIVVQERGFVACGIRHGTEREEFLTKPYAALIFSIETVMATLKSVNAFNKELEDTVSPEVNRVLTGGKDKKDNEIYQDVEKLRLMVSKARSLSPCEDYSSNLLIHLRSAIAASGARKMQDFALNKLVEGVQHRLDNFGHFLKTAHEGLIITRNGKVSESMNKMTKWIVGLTVITAFTSIVLNIDKIRSTVLWFYNLFK